MAQNEIFFLDKPNNRKTLFLDLDETLIHSCYSFENPEYILKLKHLEGTINVYMIKFNKN